MSGVPAPPIAVLAGAYGPVLTVVTRVVADPSLGGSWAPYYEAWPFALVPDDDPLYAVVPELTGVADHVLLLESQALEHVGQGQMRSLSQLAHGRFDLLLTSCASTLCENTEGEYSNSGGRLFEGTQRSLQLQVSDEILAERREKLEVNGGYKPKDRERHVSPALRAYAAMALSADKGAVRDVSLVENL